MNGLPGVNRIEDLLIRRKDSNEACLFFGDEKITYAELYEISHHLLDNFTDEQIGNNVAIFFPNSINYVKAYFSALFRKKTVIPIPYYSKDGEIISNLEYCEINLILTDSVGMERLKNISCNEFKSKLIVFSIEDRKTQVLNNDLLPLCIELSDENADVAVMLHTSGTTSNPKRVMLMHKGLIRNIESNIKSLSLNENDVTLIALPMCFGYCNTAQLLTHIYLGGRVVIMDSIFNGKSFFRLVEEYKVTNFTSVPTMLQIIDRFKKIEHYDISSLRYICFGGGNVSIELIDSIMSKLKNVGIVQTYGQTEAGPRVTALLPDDYINKRGSVGNVIPDVIVKIVDDDGNECSDGVTGNIIVNSPALMKGYYKNRTETENVLRNGWLHTGDMGYLLDGFLYLNGRKKNMIICGGMNIYPEEIEEIIQSLDNIEAVKVYGVQDEIWGEIPVADVIVTDGADFERTITEIRTICKERLSDYKIPRRIERVNEFERTYTGKIRRVR